MLVVKQILTSQRKQMIKIHPNMKNLLLLVTFISLCTGLKAQSDDRGYLVKTGDMAPDIEIRYTGLRPGEKLYEEVLSNMENTIPTSHKKIKIAKVRKYGYEEVCRAFGELERLSVSVDIYGTVKLMKEVIPEFVSKNSQFEAIDAELGERRNEKEDAPGVPADGTVVGIVEK